MICPNLNDKEVADKFQQLIDVIGDTATYDIYNKNGGNFLEKTPTGKDSRLFQDLVNRFGREQAIKIKAGIYSEEYLAKNNWLESREPNSYFDIYPDNRLDNFTANEKDSTINTILFAAFKTANPIRNEDGKIISYAGINSIDEIKDLNFDLTLQYLLNYRNQATKIGDIEAASRFIKVLDAYAINSDYNKVDYKGALFKEIEGKLDALGIVRRRKNKEELVEDEEATNLANQETNPIDGLTPAYEISDREAATPLVKMMMSFVPDVKSLSEDPITGKIEWNYNLDSFLGLPKFLDLDNIWDSVKQVTVDLVPIPDEDGKIRNDIDLMIDRLMQNSEYRPALRYVAEEIKKLTPEVQSQFYKVLSGTALNFSMTFYDKSKGLSAKLGSGNNNSPEAKLTHEWANIFESLYLIEQTDELKVKEPALEELSKRFKDFKDSLGKEVSNDTIESLKSILNDTGIQISFIGLKRAIDFIDNDSPIAKLRNLLTSQEYGLAYLYDKTLPALKKKNLANYKSPIEDEKSIIYLATNEAFVRGGLAENSILTVSGNNQYMYSVPSLGSRTIANWKTNPTSLIDYYNNDIWANSSIYIDYLLDNNTVNKRRLDKFNIILYNGIKETSESEGKESNGLGKAEMLVDSITRLHNSVGYSLANADKKTEYHLVGIPKFNAGVYLEDNEIKFNQNSMVSLLLTKYLAGELNRIRQAYNTFNILKPEERQLYYHYQSDPNKADGNAFKLFLFPSLNESKLLFDSNNQPLEVNLDNMLKNQELQKHILDNFKSIVNDHIRLGLSTGVIKSEKGNIKGVTIPKEVLDSTNKENNTDSIYQIFGDYVLNGIIANVEYTKLFTGDPAQFKANKFTKNPFLDFAKRVPLVSAPGNNAFITDDLPRTYTSIVFADLEKSSKVYNTPEAKKLYAKLIKQQKEANGIKITLEEAMKESEATLEGYNKVNVTDAQSYITLKAYRDRAIMFSKWNDDKQKAYEAILEWQDSLNQNNDRVSQRLFEKAQALIFVSKLGMQPLKTVHTERRSNPKTGIYTTDYNKQSEACLNPLMIYGTKLWDLYQIMESKGIDHAIALSGKKVGATNVVSLHDENGNMLSIDQLEAINFAPITLDYTYLALQQDLPQEGLKEKLVASQIRKNILADLAYSEDYELNGKTVKGNEIAANINHVDIEVAKRGAERFKKEVEYDEETNTFNESKVKKMILESLKKRGTTKNITKSLESNIPIEGLSQFRKLFQNQLFSILNKEVTRPKAFGGSLIQMSNYGYIDLSQQEKNGIIWLKEPSDLKAPELYIGEDSRIKIKPGQVLIPYSAVKKLDGYPNLRKDEVLSKIDKKLLEGITYRIPNQGLSSNDHIEVVGILPESVGDTIIAYSEITTKTGSDFDIDKQYIILPEYEVVDGSLKYINPEWNKNLTELSDKQLNNRRFELYKSVLMNPNTAVGRVRPLDAGWLEELINTLHPEPAKMTQDLYWMSPINQLNIRADFQDGKAGVGITANHLVDHPLLQAANAYMTFELGRGNMTEEGFVDLSRVFDEDNNKITDNISAFLNAFVDIAKDPYIVKGNVNTDTAAVVFFLLRAGVSRDYILKFIGQPILKKYIDYKKSDNNVLNDLEFAVVGGKMIPLNANNKIKLEYNIKDTKLPITLKDITDKDLSKVFDKNNPEDTEVQKKVYLMYRQLEEVARILNDNIVTSKQDVNGATNNIISALKVNQQIHMLSITDNDDTSSTTLRGFKNKFRNTALGGYTDYSLNLAIDMTRNSLIANTPTFDRLINILSYTSYKNEELAKLVEEEFYTYLLSNPQFIYQQDNIKDWFYGDNSMDKRLNRLKYGKDSKFRENPLVKFLDSQSERGDSPGFVSADNISKLTNVQTDTITEAWKELISSTNKDKESKQFALDLIKYSYYTSGFNPGLSTFYQYIPIEYIIDNEGKDFFSNTLDKLSEPEYFSSFIKQFIMNNFDTDNTLFKKLSTKEPILKFNKISNANEGFALPESSTAVIGVNDKGLKEFRRYITRNVKDINNNTTIALYRLEGYTTIKGDRVAIYSNVTKLGANIGGKKIKEYYYDQDVTSSQLPVNNKLYSPEVKKSVVSLLEDFKRSNNWQEIRNIEDNVQPEVKFEDLSTEIKSLSRGEDDIRRVCGL